MRGRVDLAGILLEEGQTWDELRAQCDRSALRVEALCGIVSLGCTEVTVDMLAQLTGRTEDELRPTLVRLAQDGKVERWGQGGADCWQVTAAGFMEVELLRTSENGGYHDPEPR